MRNITERLSKLACSYAQNGTLVFSTDELYRQDRASTDFVIWYEFGVRRAVASPAHQHKNLSRVPSQTHGLDDFGAETSAPVPPNGSLRRWGRVGVVAIAVVALAGIGVWGIRQPSSAAASDLGTLRVETDPSGAEVRIDGTTRGTTPATFTLPAGRHAVIVRRGELTRDLAVSIRPGSELVHQISWASVTPPPSGASSTPPPAAAPSVDAPRATATPAAMQSGWMSVASPVALNIYEDGRLIGVSEADRIMLPAGAHTLELTAASLGFDVRQTIRINPNSTTRVTINLPQAALSINATPWADVWIDGVAAGQTPLGGVMQPIGNHDIEFRHPQLGTKRVRVTVSLNEAARVAVDMRTP
jgi:hypothetical protein